MSYSSLKAILLRRFHLPKERALGKAVRSFSVAEKAVFYFLVVLFAGSALVLLAEVSSAYKTEVPVKGGTVTEGVVGNPRFANPVLALSEADKDLDALVYSGLVRFGADGAVINDLADKVSISKDGLTYSVHIRDGAMFSDGTPVTSDDVVFTIEKIVDPAIKSPLASDWSGVTVTKVDAEDLTFTLKKAYAPFEDNLSVGILPKEIWQNVSDDEFAFSQYNTLPIGSGSFKVGSVERDSGGIPNYFDLMPNPDFSGQKPYLAHIVFKFYPSETELMQAYSGGDIDSVGGISSAEATELKKDGAGVVSSPLPRIFGVFFNQSENPVLLDHDVRQALDLAAPKQQIVSDILGGYGTVLDGPLPPDTLLGGDTQARAADDDNLASAKALLAKDGWTANSDTGILEKKSKSGTISLSFTLSTGDASELSDTAKLLEAAWQKLGASVEVKVYATGDLNQNIIRPRHFDALLFGEVIGRGADLYPFWHSSQRNDPGLNIAMYANSKADKLLEALRTETDPSKRTADYQAFDTEIAHDVPAVFLYSPSYVYAAPAGLKGITLGTLAAAEDRFADASSWYTETDKVWNIFVK